MMSLTTLPFDANDSFSVMNRSFIGAGVNRYAPVSLVKCGLIVGEIPKIPNRVRALARVIQNADPFQFPELHDGTTGELREEAVRAVLDDLGVRLTDDEARVFPLALRECKRSLWRSTVYKDTKERAMDPPGVSRVLALCNSIDTEAAFAGAALGEIPPAVLLTFKTFSQISTSITEQHYALNDAGIPTSAVTGTTSNNNNDQQPPQQRQRPFQRLSLEPPLACHPVLLQLYECAVAPLATMHRIIREHNMYQTRRQAAFTPTETEDIAVANETLNYAVQHLLLVVEALGQSRGLRQGDAGGSSGFDTDIDGYFLRTAEQERQAARERFSMAAMFEDAVLCAAWAHCFGDATPAVLMEHAAPLLEMLFPEWSRAMMAQMLDYYGHGVLSVFGLQRAASIWGPSTVMPFRIATDLRRRASFLVGTTPKAARQHVRNYDPDGASGGSAQALVSSPSSGGAAASLSSSAVDSATRGAYAMTLASYPARRGEAVIAVFVRTRARKASPLPTAATTASLSGSFRSSGRPRETIKEFELVRREGVWKILGVTSPSGLGGYETISAAILAFDQLFVHPIGTQFGSAFFQRVGDVFKEAALAAMSVAEIYGDYGAAGVIGGGGATALVASPGPPSSPGAATTSPTSTTTTASAAAKQQQSQQDRQAQREKLAAAAASPTSDSAADATSLLHRAAYSCDTDLLRKLLSLGSDAVVNFPQADDIISGGLCWTPLVFAACSPLRRVHDALRILTAHGAEVSFVDALGNTALYYAIVNGHAAACAHLLQRDPALMATASTVSPLFVALGAHWLHPELNDIHAFSCVQVSAAVITAVLYNMRPRPHKEDVLLALDILRAKERALDKFHAKAIRRSGSGGQQQQQQQKGRQQQQSSSSEDEDEEELLYNAFVKQHAEAMLAGGRGGGGGSNSNASSAAAASTESAFGKTAPREGLSDMLSAPPNHSKSAGGNGGSPRRLDRQQRALRFDAAVREAAFSVASVDEHAAAVARFTERHAECWRRHRFMITPGQHRRVTSSIIAHGKMLRSTSDGAAELFRARRAVQDFLFFLSAQDYLDVAAGAASQQQQQELQQHQDALLYRRSSSSAAILSPILSASGGRGSVSSSAGGTASIADAGGVGMRLGTPASPSALSKEPSLSHVHQQSTMAPAPFAAAGSSNSSSYNSAASSQNSTPVATAAGSKLGRSVVSAAAAAGGTALGY